MNILLIGASGDIGQALVRELSSRHTVIEASRRAAPPNDVDLHISASVQSLLERCSGLDALVVTAGQSYFGPLESMSATQFRQGLEGKLMGQIEAALIAQHCLSDGGSITLTSGIIGESAIRFGVAAAAVNAALEGFARGAAAELRRGLRINIVSPGLVRTSADRIGRFFRGFEPVDEARVARAYARSVEGTETGQVYPAR